VGDHTPGHGFAEIEDAVDAAVMPAGLGCQIWRLGTSPLVLDVALTAVDGALERVLPAMPAGNLPERS
jgi:hypothetical protein